MRIRSPFVVAGACLALSASLFHAAPVQGGNVNYPFNSASGGWTVVNSGSIPPGSQWEWTEDSPSATEGGWHVRRGSELPGTGSYLISPCFFVDGNDGVDKKNSVYFEVFHRFRFGDASMDEVPWALGQVQYRINAGDWLGIRTSDFVSTSGHVVPTYVSPPPPFIASTNEPPPGGFLVNAWDGYTKDFGDKDHEPSAFELNFGLGGDYTFAIGDEIEFRFLMGTQIPLLDAPPELVWELNSVQIKGVTLCPEPGGIGVASVGVRAGLGGRARRRLPHRVACGPPCRMRRRPRQRGRRPAFRRGESARPRRWTPKAP
ncbi:MAG: hypothetical protein ACK6CT_12620 [Planctomycetia bacterium]